jgi:Fe-S-cluster containining protein
MLKAVPALAAYDNGAGVCRHLLADNLCAIYADRPLICNVAAMYEAYFKDSMTEAQFITANTAACQKIASAGPPAAEAHTPPAPRP